MGIALLVAIGSAMVSCTRATEPCPAGSRLAGTWHYRATQSSPAPASISGTLSIKAAACRELTGSLDAIMQDDFGQVTPLVGSVSGREVDSTTVQFDAYLATSTRQHLARLRGDSLAGTWLEATPGGASGSFSARR